MEKKAAASVVVMIVMENFVPAVPSVVMEKVAASAVVTTVMANSARAVPSVVMEKKAAISVPAVRSVVKIPIFRSNRA
jgi:hypothetical protein